MDTLTRKSPEIEKDLVPKNCRECGLQHTPDCPKDKEKIAKLRIAGHTHHCAIRQVWGDGECECHTGKEDAESQCGAGEVGGLPPDYWKGYRNGYRDGIADAMAVLIKDAKGGNKQ